MTSFTHVDTHCHVDRYDRPGRVLTDAEGSGIVVVAVSELPSAARRFRSLVGNRAMLRVAIGAHPLRAHHFTDNEKRIFVSDLTRSPYVGEVGLDYSRDHPDRKTQREVFDWVLELSAREKVLTIHSRGAERDVVAMLEARAPVAPILHWYTGPSSLIERALAAGCYFSINSAMMRTKKVRELLLRVPPNRLLTESDGPYAKRGSRPSIPSDVMPTVAEMAAMMSCDAQELRKTIWSNMADVAAAAAQSPR